MRTQQGKILFKILGVIAGLVFLGFGYKERSEVSNLKKHGERAVVEPISGYQEFKQGGSSTYTAEFHFTTADGRQMAVKHSFPEEVLEDFQAGRPVEIFYMPRSPSSFVFARDEGSWMLVGIGAGLAVVALLLG